MTAGRGLCHGAGQIGSQPSGVAAGRSYSLRRKPFPQRGSRSAAIFLDSITN